MSSSQCTVLHVCNCTCVQSYCHSMFLAAPNKIRSQQEGVKEEKTVRIKCVTVLAGLFLVKTSPGSVVALINNG